MSENWMSEKSTLIVAAERLPIRALSGFWQRDLATYLAGEEVR